MTRGNRFVLYIILALIAAMPAGIVLGKGRYAEVVILLAGILAAVITATFWYFQSKGARGEGCCRKCGFDLRGTETDGCPECGHWDSRPRIRPPTGPRAGDRPSVSK